MKITINNQVFELISTCDLATALSIYGLKETIFAVAINGKVVARTDYVNVKLQERDVVDILIPMQGG